MGAIKVQSIVKATAQPRGREGSTQHLSGGLLYDPGNSAVSGQEKSQRSPERGRGDGSIGKERRKVEGGGHLEHPSICRFCPTTIVFTRKLSYLSPKRESTK